MKPKPPVRYQYILRAIGQGLENLNVNSFDLLETSENEFVVGGNCNKTKSLLARKQSRKKSFLGLFRNNDKPITTRISVLERFSFVGLRFSRDDIELLDRKGKVLRSSGSPCPPNPHSVAQILRMTGGYLDDKGTGLLGESGKEIPLATVGGYLDDKGTGLLGLSWHHQILTLWHINGLGAEVKEEFTPANLYDAWVHQLAKRKPLRPLKRTGSD